MEPKTTPDNLAKPSPDNAGSAANKELDKKLEKTSDEKLEKPLTVDERAAEVNRDVRELAKKSHKKQSPNS